MLITIQNEYLSLCVDTLGAQMMSLQSAGGYQYLWQGDPKYWPDRALTLFPFIGRLTDNCYKYRGRVYPMGIHGFAAASEFRPVRVTGTEMVLELDSNEETLRQYPFDFAFRITFTLCGHQVRTSYKVSNLSDETMPFGIGGHPGFNVGAFPGENFEDYTIEFAEACEPDRVGFSPAVYLNGHDERYPLQDGRRLPLKHSLFDDDAIILKNMAREVTLSSSASSRRIRVSFADFPFLGIWHWPKTDAPYVCIEPWSSLPARQDVVEEFTCKSDLIQLAPKADYAASWSIEITE